MGKINRVLLMVIAMIAIMIAAVGIDKGMKFYNAKKWEKERVERYEMARADVAQIQMTISELSQDQAAIEAFIEENKEYFEDMLEAETEEGKQDGLPADGMGQETGEDLLQEDGNVSGNEGEGVGRLVKEKCDMVASIPMKGDIDSLNASVAAGVLAYEIVRQRLA